MKILLGYDDSPHAQAALRWILASAKPAGSHVTVISAVPTPIMAHAEVYSAAAPYPTEHLEQVTRHHEDLCRKAEGDLQRAGFTASSKVTAGDPREVLVVAARETGADLVVVGSHGRTGLPKLIMGSVASHVVAHAPCDVLVIKRA